MYRRMPEAWKNAKPPRRFLFMDMKASGEKMVIGSLDGYATEEMLRAHLATTIQIDTVEGRPWWIMETVETGALRALVEAVRFLMSLVESQYDHWAAETDEEGPTRNAEDFMQRFDRARAALERLEGGA